MKGGDLFRPLGVRIGIVALCAAWSALEFYSGETGWGFIALAVTVYGVWSMLIAYKPPGPPGPPAAGQ